MIVFDLQCQQLGHRFEGWFASSQEFARQREAGLVGCPACGSLQVDKAVSAPAVPRKGNQSRPLPAPAAAAAAGTAAVVPPEAARVLRKLAKMQREALRSSRWVGDRFAEDARAMHYGERDRETIHGQATRAEAEALREEGVTIAALPFPVVPPGEAN